MNNLYYLTFYCDKKSIGIRQYPKSAQTKVDYILSALGRCGVRVKVLSASGVAIGKIQRGSAVTLSKDVSLEYVFSLGSGCGVVEAIDKVVALLQLFAKMLKIKKSEALLVYHSPRFMGVVALAQRIKGFRLIIEVEELYGELFENQKLLKQELRYLSMANSYLISTEELVPRIDAKDRPHVVVHGTYITIPELVAQRDDDAIHLVYSGTFSPGKGASRAIEVMRYLPHEYVMHIAGYGTKNETDQILSMINALPDQVKSRVLFEGMLVGEKYDSLLNECDIGLCTQDREASYTLSSFPSKVISYLSHGLAVVAVKIPTLEHSEISEVVTLYNGDDARVVARAILNTGRPNRTVIRRKINELDTAFVTKLRQMLSMQ